MISLIRYTLFFLVPLAFYTIWICSFQNGWLAIISELAKKGELPGTPKGTFKTNVTGRPALDQWISSTMILFWPTNQAYLSSFLLRWFIAIGCGELSWFVIVHEAGRVGPLSWLMLKMLLFGWLGRGVGTGVTLPMFCAWDLSRARESQVNQGVYNFDIINSLRVCFAMVFFPITFLTLLPAPVIVSYAFKQQIIIVYQFWYLYVTAAVGIICFLNRERAINPRDLPSAMSAKLRSNYTFAFICAATPYLTFMLTSLTAAWLPFTFLGRLKEDLRRGHVFFPPLPWSAAPVTSLEEGLERFLQWDDIIGGTSMLLWSIALYAQRCRYEKVDLSFPELFLKAMGLSVIFGPHAAAVVFLGKGNEISAGGSRKLKVK